MTLATTLALKLTARHSKAFDLVTPVGYLERSFDKQIADGTGAAQADLFFSDTRTLAASANDDLDLAGTALVDIFGTAIAFAKIKLIYLENPATNDGNLVIGGASNPFIGFFSDASDKIAVKPGGVLLLASPVVAGYSVVATTGDILRINNAGSASVNYSIILIGTSA